MAAAHFTMFSADAIPRCVAQDINGLETKVVVIAGQISDLQQLTPPPDSCAAAAQSDLAICTLRMRWCRIFDRPLINVYIFERIR